MSEVKRYDWYYDSMLEDNNIGDYVLYSDYAALEKERDELKTSIPKVNPWCLEQIVVQQQEIKDLEQKCEKYREALEI